MTKNLSLPPTLGVHLRLLIQLASKEKKQKLCKINSLLDTISKLEKDHKISSENSVLLQQLKPTRNELQGWHGRMWDGEDALRLSSALTLILSATSKLKTTDYHLNPGTLGSKRVHVLSGFLRCLRVSSGPLPQTLPEPRPPSWPQGPLLKRCQSALKLPLSWRPHMLPHMLNCWRLLKQATILWWSKLTT